MKCKFKGCITNIIKYKRGDYKYCFNHQRIIADQQIAELKEEEFTKKLKKGRQVTKYVQARKELEHAKEILRGKVIKIKRKALKNGKMVYALFRYN